MDNCARENKNQFVLGYLCYLIKCKVFKKIELSFLPVGHTHEDVDQMFSRFSVYLKGHDSITMNDLMNSIQNSYNPKPTTIEITQIARIKQHMINNNWLNNIEGFIIN